MEKLGDSEEATLAVLKKKEKQLESILFLKSAILMKDYKAAKLRSDNVFRRTKRGPLDALWGRY